MEAATSWAVLAAISWEQTMSSSYLPVCSTTLSADSLGAKWAGPGSPTPWTAGAPPRPHPQAWGNIHQLGGSPAHRLGGRDQAFGPPRVLGIKFLLRGCPLVVTGGQGGPVKDVNRGTPDPQGCTPGPWRGKFSRGSQARCRPCHHSAHFRGLMPKRSPGGNLKPRGDLGQRGLWGQAPCRVAELCGLPTKEGAPPGPARDAPSHLTLPLSTISFCRLVDVVTRSRMACQDQDTSHLWVALPGTEPAQPGSQPATHLHQVCAGVEDPGRSRRNGEQEKRVCTVAMGNQGARPGLDWELQGGVHSASSQPFLEG